MPRSAHWPRAYRTCTAATSQGPESTRASWPPRTPLQRRPRPAPCAGKAGGCRWRWRHRCAWRWDLRGGCNLHRPWARPRRPAAPAPLPPRRLPVQGGADAAGQAVRGCAGGRRHPPARWPRKPVHRTARSAAGSSAGSRCPAAWAVRCRPPSSPRLRQPVCSPSGTGRPARAPGSAPGSAAPAVPAAGSVPAPAAAVP